MKLLQTRKGPGGARRQWGADSHQNPMPVVPRKAGEWSMLFGRTAVVVTVAAWIALVITILGRAFSDPAGRASIVETAGFLVAVTMLAASAIAYLVGRLGFYYRAGRYRRVPRAMIDEFFATSQPKLQALVPSYQEEPGVILMTLLSIALQEYPDIRVTLLVDDPPEPRYVKPRQLLESALALPAEIERLLSEPRSRFDRALERFMESADWEDSPMAEEVLAVAADYEYAADWLASLSERYQPSDHNEGFFASHVIGQLASDIALTGDALRAAAADDPSKLTFARLAQLQRRLAWTFRAELSSFQRKRYASLSDDANKAMNLNSYIGLIGGSYRELETPAGRILAPAGDQQPDLVVPDCDYVMTVDADSVILPEYCLRLVYLLERQENGRIAVAQSPYSAFPGAATRIERIAGATTDLQHIIHQGMTYHDAAFWVGANAILRKQALEDIAETEYQGGFPIRRYISDRTVIEDTESTIDLAARGWVLHNYPERLAYSATPPDFGALCIQRNRWANGGLLIIPKLVRCVRLRRERGERTGISELLLRLNYMASVFWSSLFVLCLMVIPFSGHLVSPLTYVIAMPYFVAMAVDLRYCGYKTFDALRIYGFNLLLLPVNLAGSLSSVVQALTGSKGRFMRTPKVRNRTVPAFIYIVLPYVLVAFSVYTFRRAYTDHQWTNVIFAGINAVLGAYAIVSFIGIRESLVDLWVNVRSWLYKPQRYAPAPARRAVERHHGGAETPINDWELVLYLGFADRRRAPRVKPPAVIQDPDRPVLTLPLTGPVGEQD
ncbi:MAG TPA: glycosyltransferase family 2 protein [Solirubrobacteraceae bacterium]|jgi:cellulose synthase/poly-beta-1,6-N-acetylglucosamine synthase-like glycosyltransferase|nr:glycosyltransferase family 2 protein [Solirubrobacteraceae bacterium]